MIAGLTLSAVFITASFGLQDSLAASTVTSRLTQVGWVDESVSGTFTQDQVNSALARLRQVPEVQSATSIFMGPVQVASDVTSSNLTEFGVPTDFARTYGPLVDSRGQTVNLANLAPDEIVLSHTGGQLLGLQPGDRVQIKTNFGSVTRIVRAILSHDIAVTTGEVAANLSFAEIIVPFDELQQLYEQQFHHSPIPNIICVKNVGPGGMDDAGPNNSRSQAVLRVLQSLFHVAPVDPQAPHATHFPTDFGTVQIHPLIPTVVGDTGGPPLISNKGELIGSPAARQFFLLLPVFTCLLVGAGLLLLVLLVLLLAAERRAELGMGRAIGLQRQDLVLSLLIEGGGYGVFSALLGVPLGIGMLALELLVLSHLPTVGLQFGGTQSTQATLSLALSWQSAILSGCLAILTTLLVVVASAVWISRLNVVAAIRDLDEPATQRVTLLRSLRGLWTAPRDAYNQVIPETPARRFARRMGAIGQCVGELLVCGPFLLLLGGGLLLWSRTLDQNWVRELGVLLLIAGGGLDVGWLLPKLRIPATLARRLGLTGIGIGWLMSGLQFGLPQFIAAFAPNASAANVGFLSPSLLENILSTFAPLVGVVILVMSNVDLLVKPLTFCLGRVRRLASVSRISLVFPLTFRLRTFVTIALLSLITFLVMLVVTNNLSTIQQSQVQITTGNFQLELDVDAQTNQSLGQQVLATPKTLHHDVAAVAPLTLLYNAQQNQFMPILLALPGHPRYPVLGPTIASNTFLSLTTMPMFARARGFASDQAVWNAVRDHPGYAVLQYQGGLGLATSDGFAPFTATIFTGNSRNSVGHLVTIIGIVPNNTAWSTVFLSNQTATQMGLSPSGYPTAYCFRLQPGVSAAQVSRTLGQMFHLGERGLSLTVLGTADLDSYTQTLTIFLASYLGLGLLFGAFSIGVITSRAVVERRQLIGMLRALGFSRLAVGGSFLLETSFLITLSQLVGSILAWWLISRVASQFARNVLVPLETILLLLLGSYLVILICTVVPARRASRIPPAEALRYE